MAIVKQSFLSNLVGREAYEGINGYAKIIIAIGTIILGILLFLSFFYHWWIVSRFLSYVTGTSLLFIAYIVVLIFALDVEVNVDEPEKKTWEKPEKSPKSVAYKLTIVWGIILVALGFCAIYFSNKYRKQYAFECNTFLVDHQARKYHLDDECEVAAKAVYLEKMQGYQIDNSYTFCDECEDWAEEAESEYNSNRYFRK